MPRVASVKLSRLRGEHFNRLCELLKIQGDTDSAKLLTLFEYCYEIYIVQGQKPVAVMSRELRDKLAYKRARAFFPVAILF